jgi:hypothetical protein
VGTSRPTITVAAGRAKGLIGFDLEYSKTLGRATATRRSASTIAANLLVQPRAVRRGVQLYGLAGYGVYGETRENGVGSGEVGATGLGGGAKIGIAGPLNLRVDYRLFFLGGTPDAAAGFVVHRRPQRISAGVSIAF